MVPIYEQGQGIGIGHSFDTLVRRFIEICNTHLETGRAKAFAMLFYDFEDKALKKILKSQGGFAKLDRLSGSDLSFFYLHSADKRLLRFFNDIFLKAFEINSDDIRLPTILFFKIKQGEVKDIVIVELEQDNLLFAFEEMYRIILDYINQLQKDSKVIVKARTNKLTKAALTVKKVAVEKFIELLMVKGGEFGANFLN